MHTDRSRMPIWHSHWKKWKSKMHKLKWAEVWNCKNLENKKGRSYTSSDREIRNSNKALWKMDREIRLGLYDRSITEALFTWNDENNTKSVGYEMKRKLKYEEKKSCNI